MTEPRAAFFMGRARDCAALARSGSDHDERAALMNLRTWYLQQLDADGAKPVTGLRMPAEPAAGDG